MTTQTGVSLRAPAHADPFRRMLWESVYLLTGFPIALASFVVLITGLSLPIGAVILVGLPMAIVTLLVARGFARLERARVRALGHDLPPAPSGNIPFVAFGPDADFVEVLVYTAVGLSLLMSLTPVIHRCTLVHVAVDRLPARQ